MAKIKAECPKRLRACLTALSEACGHDVFRCELSLVDGAARVIVTASRELTEDKIALLVANQLAPLLRAEVVEPTGDP